MNMFFRISALCFLLTGSGLLMANADVADASETAEIDFLDDAFYDTEPQTVHVGDPLEPFNRVMFTFNDYVYTWALDPLARGYSAVLPWDIRVAVGNFFYNLQEPVRMVNALLQGRGGDAGTLLVRFVVNTTGGIAGFGDPAGREMGFKAVDATLGETLATWGVGDGFYLVVPMYGPTTLRDFTGTVVDGLGLSPYYYWADGWEETFAIYLGKELNKLSLHLGEYENMKKLSFDPYVAIRDSYFQYRKKLRDYPAPDQE
jgi:phospholipid-binding lipoprotein MlaA